VYSRTLPRANVLGQDTSLVGFLVAMTLAPWLQPAAFRPLPGWQTGASGTTRSLYVGTGKHTLAPVESAAWIARNVRYRDDPTADPPNKTLLNLPSNAVIVWVAIFSPSLQDQPYIQLTLSRAKRFDCCEVAPVAGGVYELTGAGPGRAYSVIVRVYFGSRPTYALRAEARRALAQLRLPAPRPPSGEVTVKPGQKRIFTKAELKPGTPVRCTIQGHTLTVTAPLYPATGSGTVGTPPGKRATHLNIDVNPTGSYIVTCGFGRHHP
jgi:hypothetical protein